MNNIRVTRISGVIFLVFFTLFIGGCANIASVGYNIESGSELDNQIGKGRSIVFGQIEWIEDGEMVKIGSDITLEPHMLNLEKGHITIGFIGEGGRFVWSLEAGTYLLKQFVYSETLTGHYNVIPKVALSVPEQGKAYYIGLLKFEGETERGFLGKISGAGRFTIHDESDREIEAFKNKFNFDSSKVGKSLMVHDPRIPKTVDTPIEVNKATAIINAIFYAIPR